MPASRSLAADVEGAGVGPIRYRVIEPYRRVGFTLEPNEVQPIAAGPWPEHGLADEPWL